MKKFFILTLFLSSCTSQQGYWHKEVASQDELSQIKYKCLQEAQQPYSYSRQDYFFGGESKSEITTNSDLFKLCMNANGAYWKISK